MIAMFNAKTTWKLNQFGVWFRYYDTFVCMGYKMLILLTLLIGFAIALCFLLPMVGIPLLILGVFLYHFTIGYVIEVRKIYKERQNQET